MMKHMRTEIAYYYEDGIDMYRVVQYGTAGVCWVEHFNKQRMRWDTIGGYGTFDLGISYLKYEYPQQEQ